MMRIAVTGGTGFLGAEIVRQGVARGHAMLAVARGLRPATLPEGAVFARCDIHDASQLQEIFRGCDAVIHSAALSAPWGRRADFLHHNVAGTGLVVRAAEAAGVARLIHISSSSVTFAFRDQFNINETWPLPPPVNAYAESKQKAEDETRRFPGALFIMRPRGLFGPGDPHLLPRLLRVMRRGRLPLLRGGAALADITDVAAAADAALVMAEAPAQCAGTYNISQGEPISIRDLVETIGRELHITAQWRALPSGLAFTGARLLETVARLDPWQREPLVTAYGLGLFAYSQTLDLAAARERLHWQPKIALHDSLMRTLHPGGAATS
ncbi:MAG: NAD-dependent epimerase/dehydratase family protein [Hyphomicrobiales bacterium]